MVDIDALKNVINDSGMTITSIAKKAKIVRQVLYHRLNGTGEFTASEIDGITKALKLSRNERDDIFFNDKVELK